MSIKDFLPLTTLVVCLFIVCKIEQSENIGISDETISDILEILFD